MSIYLGSSEPSKIYVGSSEVKEVYVGTEKVRPSGWKPGSNTVMYYPFKDDQLDKVGSSSISITGTKETLGYTFNIPNFTDITSGPTTCRFISVWIKYNYNNGDYVQSPSTYIGQILYNFKHASASSNKKFQIRTGQYAYSQSNIQDTNSGVWYHLAMGYDGSKVYAYINGSNVWEATSTAYNDALRLGQNINETLSELIGESVVWTADEVSNYYNLTKSNYGL